MSRIKSPLARRPVVCAALIAAVAGCLLAGPARADNWALLIGIDHYQDGDNINPLGGADNDALALAKTLKEVAGFPENHIHVLTSGGENKPSKNTILLELARLKQRTQPGDVLFIAYSGHGIESEGVPYLLPYDALTATPDLIRDSSISEEKFRDYLKNVPAKAVVMVMDMCRVDVDKAGRAGASGDNRMTPAQVRGMDFGLTAMKPESSPTHPQIVATFFACSPEGRSYEWRDKQRGYFSYFVEQGLRGAAADRTTHTVTLDSLKRYLASAVSSEVRKQELGKDQVPTAIVDGPLAADDFALTKTVPAMVLPTASADQTAKILAQDYQAYQAQLKQGASEPFYRTYAPIRYSEWVKAAENGDPIAQLFVGYCYRSGIGVSPDRALAIKWFTQSADQGNTFAMMNLGFTLDSGQASAADKEAALQWYRKAAEGNNTVAMVNLGWMLSDKKEYPEARLWFQKAADAGYASGMRGLASLYVGGHGVARDPVQGRAWYQKAAAAGDSYSRGWLVMQRVAPAFEAYADPKTDGTARSAALATVRGALPDFRSLDLEAADTVLGNANLVYAVDELKDNPATDPLLALYSQMVDQYIRLYQQAPLGARQSYINSQAAITETRIDSWLADKKYDQIADFWKNNYAGIPIEKLTDGERDGVLRELDHCVLALLKIDDREDAKHLLDQTLAVCEAILAERPWEWYVRNVYQDLCFSAAAAFSESGDSGAAQPLLRKAWHEAYQQFGKAEDLDRFTPLPLKGEVPAGASEDDIAFFKSFGTPGKPGIRSDRYHTERFTIDVDFDGKPQPFYFFISSGPNGYAQLEDQMRWVKEYRGGTIPQNVRDILRSIYKTAQENKMDFCDLCVKTLSDTGKKKS